MNISKEVKIGPKYQVVIPKKIRKTLNLKPGKKVLVSPIDAHTIRITIDPEKWVEASYGSAKKAWGKDSDKYLKELRKSWMKREF